LTPDTPTSRDQQAEPRSMRCAARAVAMPGCFNCKVLENLPFPPPNSTNSVAEVREPVMISLCPSPSRSATASKSGVTPTSRTSASGRTGSGNCLRPENYTLKLEPALTARPHVLASASHALNGEQLFSNCLM